MFSLNIIWFLIQRKMEIFYFFFISFYYHHYQKNYLLLMWITECNSWRKVKKKNKKRVFGHTAVLLFLQKESTKSPFFVLWFSAIPLLNFIRPIQRSVLRSKVKSWDWLIRFPPLWPLSTTHNLSHLSIWRIGNKLSDMILTDVMIIRDQLEIGHSTYNKSMGIGDGIAVFYIGSTAIKIWLQQSATRAILFVHCWQAGRHSVVPGGGNEDSPILTLLSIEDIWFSIIIASKLFHSLSIVFSFP